MRVKWAILIKVLVLGLMGGAAVTGATVAQAQELYATTTVNLRAGPGVNFAVIGQIRQNEIVSQIRCTAQRDWCEISTRNQRGWVAARFFQPIAGGYRPPSAQPQPQPQPVTPQPSPQRPVVTPRPGGSPEPSPIVCFYTGFNYSGREVCAGIGDTYRELRPAWDNIIRSVRLTGYAEALVCTQPNFGGQCAVLTQSVTNLGQLAGQVSSYRVVRP